jgi:hypothetical protein
MKKNFGILGLLLVSSLANASGVPTSFTYQGKALNAAGTAPLTSTVSFTLSITDPSSACILYQESQTNVNLATTNGIFALQVGSLVGATKRVAGVDPGLTMTTVFANNGTQLVSSNGSCPGYTPAANDVRKLHVVITPSSGSAITVSPDLTINSVPNALVAETLQGFTPTQLTTYSTPAQQTLTTGTSYTVPLNAAGKAPLYLEIEMVGGGGGGGGGGSVGTNPAGGTGSSTTFGSLLIAGGGGGSGSYNPAAGGSATINTGASGVGSQGQAGIAGSFLDTSGSNNSSYTTGGNGGSTPFGAGGAGSVNGPGGSASTNSGGGGAGGGAGVITASTSSGGAGAGAYIKAIINNPLSVYTYSIGQGGSAGGAGSGGNPGGAGANGQISVTAHYQ